MTPKEIKNMLEVLDLNYPDFKPNERTRKMWQCAFPDLNAKQFEQAVYRTIRTHKERNVTVAHVQESWAAIQMMGEPSAGEILADLSSGIEAWPDHYQNAIRVWDNENYRYKSAHAGDWNPGHHVTEDIAESLGGWAKLKADRNNWSTTRAHAMRLIQEQRQRRVNELALPNFSGALIGESE
jgi:hypothetical protein